MSHVVTWAAVRRALLKDRKNSEVGAGALMVLAGHNFLRVQEPHCPSFCVGIWGSSFMTNSFTHLSTPVRGILQLLEILMAKGAQWKPCRISGGNTAINNSNKVTSPKGLNT